MCNNNIASQIILNYRGSVVFPILKNYIPISKPLHSRKLNLHPDKCMSSVGYLVDIFYLILVKSNEVLVNNHDHTSPNNDNIVIQA
jgi:hypothetical protein